jgi:hypothetical protein
MNQFNIAAGVDDELVSQATPLQVTGKKSKRLLFNSIRDYEDNY